VETENGSKKQDIGENSRTDRRGFPRYNHSGTRIRLEAMSRSYRPKREIYGHLVNSSERGICVRIRGPLRRAEVLRMFLPLIDQKTIVSTLGEVRWRKKKTIGEDEYWVGVQYLI
jgi:PilZ domain